MVYCSSCGAQIHEAAPYCPKCGAPQQAVSPGDGLKRDFFGAIRICFTQKYADFGGRAPRAEYWWWVLFITLITMAAGAVAGALDAMAGTAIFRGLADFVLFIVFVIPNLSVAVRRLHDLDKSGWWLLLNFIPLIGWIILLVWFCTRGTRGQNRFGGDPLPSGA